MIFFACFTLKGQVGIKTNRVFLAGDQSNLYGTICATKVSHLADAKFLPSVESAGKYQISKSSCSLRDRIIIFWQ